MDPRSTAFVALFAAKSLTHRRRSCPMTKGRSSWTAMSRKTPVSMCIPPSVVMSAITNSGVAKTPMRLEAEALTMAPATFPRAIEVKATDDWTVEGTSVRYRIPIDIPLEITISRGLSARPIAGNTTKVKARIVRCSFQFFRPSRASLVESRAP